jgi:glycerol uptake facilitator-like aquaporin
MLVYAICSAATVYHNTGQLGIIGIAYRSGAQVNPAVTIGPLAAGKLRPKEAALYIISQIIGAVIGAAVVYSIFGSSMSASVTPPSDGNVVRAFVLETVMTFTLVYVVLATATSKNFDSSVGRSCYRIYTRF